MSEGIVCGCMKEEDELCSYIYSIEYNVRTAKEEG
jgi:hypothetical protein